MTISSSLRRAGPYLGNDVTILFPFDFKVFGKSDVLVTLTDADGIETKLELDSDYSVALNADQGASPGGTVTYPLAGSPLPASCKLTLSGSLAYTQPTDITNQGGFYPEVLEDAFDRSTVQIQQLAEQNSRAVLVPISDPRTPDDYWQALFVAADAAATSATASAAAASASETESAASAGEAADSEALAHKWASDPEDVEVEPGEFSAYHYMKKAKSIANAEASTVVVVPTSELPETDVQAALERLAGPSNVLASSINGGPLAGMRNKIINGNFGINQLNVSGTVALTPGLFGHDRWRANAAGCTYTFSTSNNVTTITITAGTLVQVIEGINLQSGQHVLSWQGTAQGRVDDGAYGPSGVVGTAVGGTNQQIEFGVGTLSLVQYEPGTVKTPFEQRDYGSELLRCQRYLPCFSIDPSGSAQRLPAYGIAFDTNTARLTLPFHGPSRIKPSGLVVSNPAHFLMASDGYVADQPLTSFTFDSYASRYAVRILIQCAGGPFTAGQSVQLSFNAGYVCFTGCEL